MKKIQGVVCCGMVMVLLLSCSPVPVDAPPATSAPTASASPTATAAPQATLTPTTAPEPAASPTPSITRTPAPLPLSAPGPHFPGRRTYAFTDASRANRPVAIAVWYPAIKPEGYAGTVATNADGDRAEAPYPLIVCSTIMGNIFGPHLASYGFVVVGVEKMKPYFPWNQNLVDYPLDLLFALEQAATAPLEGLDGMIEADNAGAMGYSFDGYNALALGGARADPEQYRSECGKEPLKEHWVKWGYCDPASKWEAFSAHAGEAITTSEDGLWQPMTSERIRAVAPMGPEGAALFGERGLAAVQRPTLIIAGTADTDTDYFHEVVFIYEHIGAADKTLISFMGQDHLMVLDAGIANRMAHFITAFFGHQLQGREDYARLYAADYLSQFEDVRWGVYAGD